MACADLSNLANDSVLDVEAFRSQLAKMSEVELLKTRKDLAFRCSPRQNFGKPAREIWALQLAEALTPSLRFFLPMSALNSAFLTSGIARYNLVGL
jgi:hypothetical protein